MLRYFTQAQLSFASRHAQRSSSFTPSRTSFSTSRFVSRSVCHPTRSAVLSRAAPAPLASAKRFKSSKTTSAEGSEESLGDEPPLYDGKPAWWARWAYALVALDVLFTGFTVDMIMNKWTRLEEVESSTKPGEEAQRNTEYVLRPLSQRLGLAGLQFLVGTAAAAYILASRDRTVWRMRIKRMSLMPHVPPSKSSRPLSRSENMQNVLVLETASGRTKRFRMKDCSLLPGRHLGELLLRITAIRGQFTVSLRPQTSVLGTTTADNSDVWVAAPPSPASKSTNSQKDFQVHSGIPAQTLHPSRSLKGKFGKNVEDAVKEINRQQGDGRLLDDSAESLSVEAARTAELRRLLGRAWMQRDGSLVIYRDESQASQWTDGPLAKSRPSS